MIDARQWSYLVYITSSLLLLLIAVPYAVLSFSEMAIYYGVGPISPLILSLLPLISIIGIASAQWNRSDPPTVAGIVLIASLFFIGLTGWWMIEAQALIGGLTINAMFQYHPWSLLIGGIGLLGCVIGYAITVIE
ncbi:MAG: hypothetical protein ABEI06_00030 [Halobacteriaceae archaeon]